METPVFPAGGSVVPVRRESLKPLALVHTGRFVPYQNGCASLDVDWTPTGGSSRRLLSALQAKTGPAFVILDARDRSTPELLTTLHRRFRRFPVAVLSHGSRCGEGSDLGVSSAQVQVEGTDMPSVLREIAARARDQDPWRSLIDRSGGRVGQDTLVDDFAEWCATVLPGGGDVSVRSAARELAVSGRTLTRHVHAVAGCKPISLLGATLVLRAALLLQDPSSSIGYVARTLPFSCEAAVHARFAKYGGQKPSMSRSTQGFWALQKALGGDIYYLSDGERGNADPDHRLNEIQLNP